MSESADCRLKIAHRIVGTEEQLTRTSRMNLRMGTVLEGEILAEFAEAGCSFTHTKINDEGQLEIACQDPYRVGHPEGFAQCDPTKIDAWLLTLIPDTAVRVLLGGQRLFIEIKTMNDDSWKHFKRKGLGGHPWLSRYEYQIQTYLHTILHDHELWPDLDFGDDPPWKDLHPSILVVGFNKANSQYAMQHIAEDPQFFQHISGQLEEMTEWLHAGEMPAPDHDGRHMECRSCPFAWCCPAVEDVATNQANPKIATADEKTAPILDDLAQRYEDARDQEKSGKDEKGKIKDILVEACGLPTTIQTARYRISLSDVAGGTIADNDALEVLAKKKGFTIPTKDKKGHVAISVNPRYGVKDA